MDIKAPPTLLELAIHSLLKDEALAISALEILPRELFPSLFKEALTSGQNHIVQAMVAAWPFPCLPVGSLMQNRDPQTLQSVLRGTNLLLTQEVRPRRWKLQVVELGNVDSNFWSIWAGAQHPDCSTQVPPRKPRMQDHPRFGEKQLLKVVADFQLENQYLDEYHRFLLQWAQLRKGSVQLCCRKLQGWTHLMSRILEVLKIFKLDSIQEFELNSWWKAETLIDFAPYLGQMQNLRRLVLAGIHWPFSGPKGSDIGEKCALHLVSQFTELQSLQHLHLNDVSFLRNHLKQLFWCLKTPLETLSITDCPSLSAEDIGYLSSCWTVRQLTHLNFSGTFMFYQGTMSMQVLLQRVSGTLQSLVLQDCMMEDSQLSTLLPALRLCTQLTEVNFYGNNFSLDVLKNLLCHTAHLSQLTLELYPAPLETYDRFGGDMPEIFFQVCSHLMDTLCILREPRKVCFASFLCEYIYNLGTIQKVCRNSH